MLDVDPKATKTQNNELRLLFGAEWVVSNGFIITFS